MECGPQRQMSSLNTKKAARNGYTHPQQFIVRIFTLYIYIDIYDIPYGLFNNKIYLM
jgi:hypothetical protein